jgi:hypothetical protein
LSILPLYSCLQHPSLQTGAFLESQEPSVANPSCSYWLAGSYVSLVMHRPGVWRTTNRVESYGAVKVRSIHARSAGADPLQLSPKQVLLRGLRRLS